MPIGAATEVPAIVLQLITLQPKSVLDLGIGFGFYGVAVRQWLDMGYDGSGVQTTLHGVEGFEQYRNPVWELYDRVEVGDILTYQPHQTYDCVLLCDVLEHFDKDAGRAFLALAKTWLNAGGKFIITTPAIDSPQGAAYGNEFERHRSVWSAAEMAAIGFEILNGGAVDKYGCQMLTVVFTA